jgi:hypothetical protein
MSNSNEALLNAEFWSLPLAAFWIETRTRAKPGTSLQISTMSVRELERALKAGEIIGSGHVDSGERRAISQEERHDYFLKLRYATFVGASFMNSPEIPVIDILSVRSFPAAALKYHAYPSGVRIPSPSPSDGEPGYHRVITDVLLPRQQVIERWRHDADLKREPETQSNTSNKGAARKRPGRERAQNAINQLYPNGVPDQATEENSILCRRVGQWLKDNGLAGVSNDTILRAAGRREG